MIRSTRCSSTTTVLDVITRIVEPMLGCCESVKCVIEEEECVLTNCSAILLQNLDIQHPIGQLVNSAVQDHHKQYGNGCKTLIIMIGYWWRSLKELVDQGILPHSLIVAFSQGIELCIDIINEEAVRLLKDEDVETANLIHTEGDISSSNSSSIEVNNINEVNFEDGFVEIELATTTVTPVTDTTINHSRTPQAFDKPDDDDGDVGWFFGEGVDPGPPQLDSDAVELLMSATNLGMGIPHHCNGVRDPVDIFSERPSVPTETCGDKGLRFKDRNYYDPLTDVSTIKAEQDDEDSEFDSCFDDVSSSDKKLDCKDNYSIQKVPKATEDSDSEFDSCFDDVPVGRNSPCENASDLQTSPEKTIYQGDDNNQSSSNESLEEKLRMLMNRKGNGKATKTLNRSRHFKTIESTVQELSDQCVINDQQSPSMGKQNPDPGKEIAYEKDEDANSRILNNPCSDCDTTNNKSFPREKSDFIPPVLPSHRNGPGLVNVTDSESSPDAEKSPVPTKKFLDDRLETYLQKKTPPMSMNSLTRHFKPTQSAVKEPNEDPDPSNTSISKGGRSSDYNRDNRKDQDSLIHQSNEEALMGGCKHQLQNLGRNISLEDNLDNKSRTCVSLTDIDKYGPGLSHGSDEMMQLAMKCLECQIKTVCDREETCFELVKITSLSLYGPHFHDSTVVEGLVVQLNDHHIVAQADHIHSFKALLINGDVTPNYRHLGFKKIQKTQKVISFRNGFSQHEDSWLDSITAIFRQLNINAVFMKGTADDDLIDHCNSHGIALFPSVSYKTLQAISVMHKVHILSYVTDAIEEDVAKNMEFDLMNRDVVYQLVGQKTSTFLVNIKSQDVPFQTAVICHPVVEVSKQKEEDFWHCCHRLSNSITSMSLIRGGCATERICIEMLQSHSEASLKAQKCGENYQFNYSVMDAISMGFHMYCKLVEKNTSPQKRNLMGIRHKESDTNNSNDIYDDVTAKFAAWRTAGHIVSQLMLCDTEILTGQAGNPELCFL